MKTEKKSSKPTPETPVPEGMRYLEYYVLEEVSYQRALFVPETATEDKVLNLVTEDWQMHGHPVKDCIAVNEQAFEFEMDDDQTSTPI
jgi:hypothetical protein